MKTAKFLSFLGIMAMSAVLIFGFIQGDFLADGGTLLQNPWGVVSLVDLYVGFTLFSIWIAFREKNILLKVLWILAMMILGFFAGALYVFINLIRAKGDLLDFFFGDRKKEVLQRERKSGKRSEEDGW